MKINYLQIVIKPFKKLLLKKVEYLGQNVENVGKECFNGAYFG